MAKTALDDLLGRVKQIFTPAAQGVSNAFQAAQRSFSNEMVSPLPQRMQYQPTQPESFGNKLMVGLGNSSFGKGLVSAQNFIQSPKSFQLPQVPNSLNPTISAPLIPSLKIQPVQMARDFINTPVSYAANTLSDTGQNIGNLISGQPMAQYNNLKSSPAKFGYNVAGMINPQATQAYGINQKAPQVIGNVAGSVLGPASVYGGGKILGVGNKATEVASQTIWNALKNSAISGAKYGGTFGVLSGLDQAKDQKLTDQLKSAVGEGALNAFAGAILGTVVTAGQYGIGAIQNKVISSLKDIKPKASEAQLKADANDFLHNELGRFVGKKPSKEQPWVGDLRESLGLDRYGKYDKGFINPGEIVPGKLRVKPNLTQQVAESSTGLKLKVRPSTPVVEPPPIEALKQPSTPVNVTPETNQYLTELQQSQQKARSGENLGIVGSTQAFLSDVKSNMVDGVAPIEDILNAQKRKGLQIKPSEDIGNQIDRSKRATVLAGQFIKDNGLEQVIKDVPDINALDQYLIAKQAKAVTGQGITTGRNSIKDEQLLAELNPTYEAYAQKIKTYTHSLLDYATNTGLVSKKLNAELKTKYPDYVPLNRIFTEGELAGQKGYGAGPASLSKQTIVQKLKGSTREIQSPMASLLLKTQDAFKQGERNLAGKMLAGYRNLEGFKGLITELPKGKSATNTFTYLEDGVKKTFRTTPEIAAAAKSLDAQQLGVVGQVLAAPVRVARVGITGLNVPFVGANIVKDQVTGAINSTKSLQTSILNPGNFVKSLWAALGHGAEYENWIRAGAGGTSFDIARNAPEISLGRLRANRNIGSKVAYTITHPSQILRTAENVLARGEELTRIQQFTGTRDALLKEGMPVAEATIEAARQSRKATVDFARSGNWGRALNSVWLYLNAGIQGGRTLLGNLRDRPVQTVAKIGLVGMTPVAMTTLWNLSDPQRKAAYDDIQEYEKDNNLILVPNNPTKDPKTGKWNVIKVPLSQEIANLTVPMRHMLESLSGGQGTSFGEVAAALTSTATGLNLSSPTALVSQAIPQAIKPVAQATFNKNFFTGGDIVPNYMTTLPPEMQVRDNTSGTARLVGKALNTSPLKVEQMTKDIFGGVGSQLLNASDTALNKAGVIPPEQVGGQSIPEGITARFNQASGGQQLSNLYDSKALANNPSNTLPAGVVENNGSYYVKVGKSVKSFDTPEDAKIAIDKEAFKQSGENFKVIGENVFRLSKGGTISTMPKLDYDTLLSTQKMENAKAAKDYDTWGKLANEQLKNFQAQLMDPTLDELEKMTIQQKADALIASAIKYQGYGGFTKGKKLSVKMPALKIVRPKFARFRTKTKKSKLKVQSFKPTKAPVIKVNRVKRTA